MRSSVPNPSNIINLEQRRLESLRKAELANQHVLRLKDSIFLDLLLTEIDQLLKESQCQSSDK